MFEKGLLRAAIDKKFKRNNGLITEEGGVQTLPLHTNDSSIILHRRLDEQGKPTTSTVEFTVDEPIGPGIKKADRITATIEPSGAPRLSEDHLRSLGRLAGETLPRHTQWRLAAKILLRSRVTEQ